MQCNQQHPMPTFSFQGVIHTTKTSPWNNSYRPKLCRLCCTLTTTKLPPPGAGFLGLQNYCVKIQKILTAHQFMCCFKKSKLMQGKCPKGCITWWQKKHVLAPHGRTSGAIPPPQKKFCECALWSHTYIPDFIQIHSVLRKNPSTTFQSECNTRSLSL